MKRLVRAFTPALLALLSVACSQQRGAAPNPDIGEGAAKLSWHPPTENQDGEPLTDLHAYMVLYGRSPDDLKYWKRIEDPAPTSFVVTGLGKGVWYFSVVAVNSEGRASEPSAVVSKEVR